MNSKFLPSTLSHIPPSVPPVFPKDIYTQSASWCRSLDY
jgi:hypothetical protein